MKPQPLPYLSLAPRSCGPVLARVAALALAIACILHTSFAAASVRKAGTWPEGEKAVTFRYDGPREGGLDKLAEEAGWSLVLSDKAAMTSSRTVSVSLKNQPPADVLEALLDDGEFVATRKGTLVRLELVDAGSKDVTAADAPAEASAAQVVTTHKSDDDDDDDGDEMKVMGGRGDLEKGRTVKSLTVMGGHCDVYGHVTGDLAVMGGTVVLHDGAVVEHDATTMGGHIEIEKGAEVRGHVLTLGGSIHRQDGAVVSGHVEGGTVHSVDNRHERGFMRRVGDAVSNTALLFVLGVIFLAVAPKRMETLRVEVARAPMKQLGFGIVGFFGFLLAAVLLCVTIVGVPVALVGIFLGIVAMYGGMVAALTVVGAALVRHKSENPYAHLAVGCALFFVVYPLPWIGPWLVVSLMSVGIGALVTTRVAGYFPEKKKKVEVASEGPYR
jgi:hypothetical protein